MSRPRFHLHLLVTLGVVVVWFLIPGTLYGHAYMVGSDPRADATLESAPARVTVVFAEAVEPAGSRIRILDARGERVETGESTVDPASPRRISVTINQELEDGTYTVLWRNVSARDGHPLQDFFLFSVGEPLDSAAVAPGARESAVSSPVAAVGRWLAHIGLALILGGLFFHLAAVDPIFSSDSSLASVVGPIERRRWSAVATGVFLILIGSVGELVGQSRIMEAAPAIVLSETTWGSNWLLRMGFWVVLAAVLVFGYRWARSTRAAVLGGSERGTASSAEPIAILVGAGMLFALALTSHVGVGTGVRAPAVLNHFVHKLAGNVWVGCLMYLALVTPILINELPSETRPGVIAPMLRKYWAATIVCVITLVITGIYNTWIQVTIPVAATTTYGETLIVKVLLVVILFAAAGADLLYVRPKIAEQGSSRLFRGVVRGEVVLGVLILLTVGFLAGTEPARLAADRLGLLAPDRDTVFRGEDEGTQVVLSVEPALVGRNRLVINLEDSLGNPISAESVAVQVRNVPAETVEFERTPSVVRDGRYVAERVALTMPGTWQADIVVTRADAFDARVSFQLQVAEQTVETSDLLTTDVAWSVVAGQIVLIVLMVWIARSLSQPRSRSEPDNN